MLQQAYLPSMENEVRNALSDAARTKPSGFFAEPEGLLMQRL